MGPAGIGRKTLGQSCSGVRTAGRGVGAFQMWPGAPGIHRRGGAAGWQLGPDHAGISYARARLPFSKEQRNNTKGFWKGTRVHGEVTDQVQVFLKRPLSCRQGSTCGEAQEGTSRDNSRIATCRQTTRGPGKGDGPARSGLCCHLLQSPGPQRGRLLTLLSALCWATSPSCGAHTTHPCLAKGCQRESQIFVTKTMNGGEGN